MSKPVRIGIIGAGANTRLRHLPGFQAIDGVEVTVLCNRSEASGRSVADDFKVPSVETDWRKVVVNPEVDAVCIGTWPNMHADITIAALEAGKHVQTEARMARNLKEAEAMHKAARDHPELITQIVPAPFSLDHDATIMRVLGELGTLYEVNVVHRCGIWARSDTPSNWRQDFELSGKNTQTLGILYETVQRWLGAIDPDWLVADAETVTKERPDGLGGVKRVGIPDAISVFGRYASGVRFSYDISSVDNCAPLMEIRLNAEKGSLRIDLMTQTLYLSKPGVAEAFGQSVQSHEAVLEPDPGTALGWKVEADFIESIRSGQPARLTSFDDGLRYMRFTELVWESWNSGSKRMNWNDV